MAVLVEAEGLGTFEFPDEATEEQISEALTRLREEQEEEARAEAQRRAAPRMPAPAAPSPLDTKGQPTPYTPPPQPEPAPPPPEPAAAAPEPAAAQPEPSSAFEAMRARRHDKMRSIAENEETSPAMRRIMAKRVGADQQDEPVRVGGSDPAPPARVGVPPRGSGSDVLPDDETLEGFPTTQLNKRGRPEEVVLTDEDAAPRAQSFLDSTYEPGGRNRSPRTGPKVENRPGTVLSRTYDATMQRLQNVPENLAVHWNGIKQANAENHDALGDFYEIDQKVAEIDDRIDAEWAKLLEQNDGNEDAARIELRNSPIPILKTNKSALLSRYAERYGIPPDDIEAAARLTAQFHDAGVRAREAIEKSQKSLVKVDAKPGTFEYYFANAAGSVTEMGVGLVATLATRNPAPMMAWLAGFSYGGTYVDSRQRGLSPEMARGRAVLTAMSEAAAEYFPLKVLLKPGSGVFTRLFATGEAEAIEETFSEGLQIGIDLGYFDEDMTWGEAKKRLADANILGRFAGWMMGGGVGALEAGAQATGRSILGDDMDQRRVNTYDDMVEEGLRQVDELLGSKGLTLDGFPAPESDRPAGTPRTANTTPTPLRLVPANEEATPLRLKKGQRGSSTEGAKELPSDDKGREDLSLTPAGKVGLPATQQQDISGTESRPALRMTPADVEADAEGSEGRGPEPKAKGPLRLTTAEKAAGPPLRLTPAGKAPRAKGSQSKALEPETKPPLQITPVDAEADATPPARTDPAPAGLAAGAEPSTAAVTPPSAAVESARTPEASEASESERQVTQVPETPEGETGRYSYFPEVVTTYTAEGKVKDTQVTGRYVRLDNEATKRARESGAPDAKAFEVIDQLPEGVSITPVSPQMPTEGARGADLGDARPDIPEGRDRATAPDVDTSGPVDATPSDGRTAAAVQKRLAAGRRRVKADLLRKVAGEMQSRLAKAGLPDVQVVVSEDLPTQGRFVGGTDGSLTVLIGDTLSPGNTVRHETIHILRHLKNKKGGVGLFTNKEWAALTAEAERTWMAKHDIEARYPDLTREEQIEEAIAEEYSQFRGRAPTGIISKAFAKIGKFMRTLRDTLTSSNVRTVDDIFEDITTGRVGARRAGGVPNVQPAQKDQILPTLPSERQMRSTADLRSTIESSDALEEARVEFERSREGLLRDWITVEEYEGARDRYAALAAEAEGGDATPAPQGSPAGQPLEGGAATAEQRLPVGKVTGDVAIGDGAAAPTNATGIDDRAPVKKSKATTWQGVTKRFTIENPNAEAPRRALILGKTEAANADRQTDNLDILHERHPEPLASVEAWAAYLNDAFGSDRLMMPPWRTMKIVREGSSAIIGEVGGMPEAMRDATTEGMEMAQRLGELYAAGEVSTDVTAQLFLWSFLSRGVSPYVQEAAFLDVVTSEEFSDIANEAAADGWTDALEKRFGRFARSAIPMGSPGRGTQHNLNAFGRNFLRKMSEKHAEYDNRTGLQIIHDMIVENETTRDIRRTFLKVGDRAGIDNKVVSFTLLLAGRTDALVLDRIQARNQFDDGRFSGENIYDTKVEGGKQITGSGIATLTFGHKGLIYYEAMEDALAPIVEEAYADMGWAEGSLGRYHWDSWVVQSNQEVGHASVEGLVRAAEGRPNAYVGAFVRNGKFNEYDYGFRYLVGPDGHPSVAVVLRDGKTYFLPHSAMGSGKPLHKALSKINNDLKRQHPDLYYKSEASSKPEWTVPWVSQMNEEQHNAYEAAIRSAAVGAQNVRTDTADAAGREDGGGRGVGATVRDQALDTARQRGAGAVSVPGRGAQEGGRDAQGARADAAPGAVRADTPVSDDTWQATLAGSEEALRELLTQPGWAVITGMREDLRNYWPPYLNDAPEAEQQAYLDERNDSANEQLRATLEADGVDYVEVRGRYEGVDQGLSFLIRTDERTALRYGNRFSQESILTNKGLVFVKPLPTTPATGTVMVGDEARAQDFYSEGEKIPPFSMGLRFDVGPGEAVIPEGYTTIPSRPQLPIAPDGMVELHHWSSVRLDTIDPKFAGTGPLRGAERSAGLKQSFYGINPRANQRDPGTGYVKESGLGPHHHIVRVRPETLYPWFEDPDGLRPTSGTEGQQRVMYSRAIREAGYPGYYVTADKNARDPRAPLGNVAVLFEAMPAELLPAKDPFARRSDATKDQRAPINTPEFRRWFGDSKVVDENGDPLVVYHGTRWDFDEFQVAPSRGRQGSEQDAPGAFWFASNRAVAETYAADDSLEGTVMRLIGREKPQVQSVYLSMQNPFVFDMRGQPYSEAVFRDVLATAKENGHDGAILKNTKDDGFADTREATDVYAVFRPTQIKSVNNRGTFDGNSPRILDQRPMAQAAETAPASIDPAEAVAPTSQNQRLAGQTHVADQRIYEALAEAGRAEWADMGKPKLPFAKDQRRSYDGAIEVIADRFFPLLRVQQEVEARYGITLPESADAYLQEELHHGKVMFDLMTVEQEYTEPMAALLAKGSKQGLTSEMADDYFTALHAEERNARMSSINPNLIPGQEGSGMTTAEARRVIADFQQGPHMDILNAMEDRVAFLRDWIMNKRVSSGLLSQEEANIWNSMYDHYVPLRGWRETDNNQEGAMDMRSFGKNLSVAGRESKRAIGRTTRSRSPLAELQFMAQEVAVRAAKNDIGNALLNMVEAFPHPAYEIKQVEQRRFFNTTTGMVQTMGVSPTFGDVRPNEFATKRNGEEVRIVFNDEGMTRALGKLGSHQFDNKVAYALMQYSRYFSMMNTMLAPSFAVVNPTRDIQTALLNLQSLGEGDRAALSAAAIKYWRQSLMEVWRGQENLNDPRAANYRDFIQNGGQVAFWQVEDPDYQLNDLHNRARNKASFLHKAVDSVNVTRHGVLDLPLLRMAERANLAMDNAVRLAVYRGAVEAGWSKAKAASLAKNLTVNFNRRGTAGPVFNMLYTFSNAAFQSVRVAAIVFQKNPLRMAAIAGSLYGLGYVVEMLGSSMSDEDEDGVLKWDKINDASNRRYLPLPGTMNEEGNFAKLPLAYFWNAFVYAGMQSAKYQRGVKDGGDVSWNILQTVVQSNSPVDITSPKDLLPTILQPAADVAFNEDFFGSPVYPSYKPEGSPSAYNFYGSVGEGYRVATDLANRLTGGDETYPGLIDVNPSGVEHIVENMFFGGAGRDIEKLTRALTRVYFGETEDMTLRSWPVIGKLQGGTGRWVDKDRFYRFTKEVSIADRRLRDNREEGTSINERDRALAKLKKRSLAAQREMKKLREKRNRIYEDTDLGRAERYEKLRPIWDKEHEIMLDFNRRYTDTVGPVAE